MATNPNTDALIAAGTAIAGTLAPLAGPYGVLAEQLLSQGLTFWTEYQRRKASGELTMADLESAAKKVGEDLDGLRRAIEEAEATPPK
jgi:hypothetical protein